MTFFKKNIHFLSFIIISGVFEHVFHFYTIPGPCQRTGTRGNVPPYPSLIGPGHSTLLSAPSVGQFPPGHFPPDKIPPGQFPP